MLKVEKINKIINGRSILSNISFVLAKGEIISVIGPSGAGKTSLLKAVSLLDPPDSGSLTVNAEPYVFPLKESTALVFPYPRLTVVFQQLFLWPHLTIRQNIELPLRGSIDIAYFKDLVRMFQMEEFLERYPNEVSTGQKQRAAFVRALMLKPDFLLLDEVTAALDIEQSYLILRHLKQIAEKGVGIIFVTHALHFASKISDKIIFMEDGRIIEEGSPRILKGPVTPRLKNFLSISEAVI